LPGAGVRLQVPAHHLGGHRLLQRGLVHPAEDRPQRAGDVAGHPAEGGGAGGRLQRQSPFEGAPGKVRLGFEEGAPDPSHQAGGPESKRSRRPWCVPSLTSSTGTPLSIWATPANLRSAGLIGVWSSPGTSSPSTNRSGVGHPPMSSVSDHGRRAVRCEQELLPLPGDVRHGDGGVGRREPGVLLQDLAVWGQPGDPPVLPRGSRVPQKGPLLTEQSSGQQREGSRGLDGRVQRDLLPPQSTRATGGLWRRDRATEAAREAGM
ncbi:unnamed protein product, partial [Tetraodon nigroviridis]